MSLINNTKKARSNSKLNLILILGILTLSFSISFMIKIMPSEYGWELNEFDPFFNYRATQYIVENGLSAYFEWNDDLSWYPAGRDVSSNSQVFLHIFTATMYWIFGIGMNLYDFSIILPVIVGSLSCFIIFGLVRTIAGTTSGLFASLLFSVSLPILVRGSLGWLKSEPLGLFFGLLSTFLILNALKSNNSQRSYLMAILSGITTVLGLSSWGGNIFFLIPIGVLFCLIPFVRKEHIFFLKVIPLFTVAVIISSLFFERISYGILSNLTGYSIIFPTIIMGSIILIQKISNQRIKFRNSLIFLICTVFFISILVLTNDSTDIFPSASFRYLNAIFPILTTTDPLTDSVSEHVMLNISQSYQFHSVLLIFSGLGIWLLFNKSTGKLISKDMIIFSLSLGIFGAYIGSAFMRLEVFTSIALIILASIGLSLIIKLAKLPKKSISKKILFSYSSFSFVFIMLLIPLFLPESSNVLAVASSMPPTILNGATLFEISTNDWRESLEWIKDNTPERSVISSWWDYGYWIQTIAERPSLVDNSTLIDHRIKSIAKIFFETPDDAWKSLMEMETDYFIVFVVGEQLPFTTQDGEPMYSLNGGGDESKKIWFAKIAGLDIPKYIHSDSISGTPFFWENSFLGKIIPFEILGYVNFQTDQISTEYVPGWFPVYLKHIKLIDESDPFKLVYSSSSFEEPIDGLIIGVFVYEINKNYVPLSDDWISPIVKYKND